MYIPFKVCTAKAEDCLSHRDCQRGLRLPNMGVANSNPQGVDRVT